MCYLLSLKLALLAGADADSDPQIVRCHPAVCLLQAALCAAQCRRWHCGEQYCARWHLLHSFMASSCSEGALRFWHLHMHPTQDRQAIGTAE